MKVLHISTADFGGAAIAAIRLHNALLAKNIDSSMLFLYRKNDSIPNSNKFEFIEKKRANYFIQQFLYFKNKIFHPPFSNDIINQQKLQNHPFGFEQFSFNRTDFDITQQKCYKEADIVHLHWIAGFVDYIFFTKNKKPVVWTLHDMFPFTGGCHYSNGCNKYFTECKNCPQLQGTIDPNNAYKDQQYKKSCLSHVFPTISSPSLWLKECSERSKLFGAFKNFHIPYSLDLSVYKFQEQSFCRKKFNLPQNKKILLFVCDTIENKRKGFDLLIDSLSLLQNSNIHICAIGERNDNTLKKSDITYLGRITDEHIMAMAYSAADAFILPSREDNLPNTMLEALSCGTPVISFSVGGMHEYIKTGFNGILAENLNAKSLANSINIFFQDKYVFNKHEIRKNAMKIFSPAIQANKYIEVYNSILQQ